MSKIYSKVNMKLRQKMFSKMCDDNYGIYRNLTSIDLGVSAVLLAMVKVIKKSLGKRYVFNLNMKLNRFKKRADKVE